MTLGDKLNVIANSQYLKFAEDMNAMHLDASLSLVVLDAMRGKLLEQIYISNLELQAKNELTREDD